MEGDFLTVLAATHGTGDVLFWCLVLMGFVAVMGVGAWLIRRRLFSTPATSSGDDWSLQQLREMKAGGQISEAEFERLRSMIIAQYQASKSAGAENARDAGAGESDDSTPSIGENGVND